MLQRNQLHSYQERGVNHILDNEFCALFLDMGLGKTVTTLTAIKELLDGCIISNALIVAPKKVTQTTWRDEIKNWAHRVGSIGNAVNPCVAKYLFECIKEFDKQLA